MTSTTSSSEIITPIATMSDDAYVLADIYQPEYNLAVYQRTLSPELTAALDEELNTTPCQIITEKVTSENCKTELLKRLPECRFSELLAQDVNNLVDMFSTLFEQERVGVRLTITDKAMCPNFHVDHIPCRLVTVYSGPASQWLEASHELAQVQNNQYNEKDIQSLNVADVALLKGEGWLGNEGFGLIHRSPPLEKGQKRLILTLDFLN